MTLPKIEFDSKVSDEHKLAVHEYINKLRDMRVPVILSLEHFSYIVGLKIDTIFGITNSPSSYYRSFSVDKSSGGKRRISAPLPTLLSAQRWILHNILESQPCHPAAKAYIKGISIRSNAKFHRAQAIVFKVDVKNFFGSITEFQVTKIFKSLGYRPSVSIGLSKLCCLDGALPQGAATSGYLSNLLLRDFDAEILKFSQERGLRYTRYADDITISGSAIDKKLFLTKISQALQVYSLRLNHKKTQLLHQNHRQKVTGVVVNKKLSVENSYLREIRKEHYYIMKYGIFGHARRIGASDPRMTLDKIIGQVSHAFFVRSHDTNLASIKKDLLLVRSTEFGY